MKYQISTSIAGLLRGLSLVDALDTVKQAGFTCLDFPISVFSRPENSPLKSDQWRLWTDDLSKGLSSMGFVVTQAHASWEQAIPEDLSPEVPYEVYYRTIEACAMLGCKKLVFHPPLYFFRMKGASFKAQIQQWNVEWFQALLPALEKFGVTAELENLFDYRHIRRPEDPAFPYSRGADLLELVERLDSPWVKLCLDTGHANIAEQDPAQMVRDYGRMLEVLHLNDNFGFITPVYEDLHLLPGCGNLSWPPIFAALKEVN